MLEGDNKSETEWYKNTAFVKELDEQYKAWKSGKDIGYTMDEVGEAIERLNDKRRV